MKPTKKAVDLTLETDKALKILGYDKWKPELGDWWLQNGNLKLIGDALDLENAQAMLVISPETSIPIFHWEQIKGILQKNGYVLTIWLSKGGGKIVIYSDPGRKRLLESTQTKLLEKMYSGEPQLAVMRAVILLAKEVR